MQEHKKFTHGGFRPGSGRKPLAEGEALQPVSIKLSLAQRAKLSKLGGASWIRARIDKAKLPDE